MQQQVQLLPRSTYVLTDTRSMCVCMYVCTYSMQKYKNVIEMASWRKRYQFQIFVNPSSSIFGHTCGYPFRILVSNVVKNCTSCVYVFMILLESLHTQRSIDTIFSASNPHHDLSNKYSQPQSRVFKITFSLFRRFISSYKIDIQTEAETYTTQVLLLLKQQQQQQQQQQPIGQRVLKNLSLIHI